MRPTRTATIVAVFLLSLALPAAAAAKALLIDGSTSMFPLVTQLAAAYHKATHKPEPKVGQGTSDAGISDVNDGRVDIADVSRNPIIGVDPKGLIFTKVARDGVCVITNDKNPIKNFSTEEIKSIFTGTIRDWSEVPGAAISGPIDLVDRVASSGTQQAFEDIFLGEGTKISPSAEAQESNGLVQSKVRTDEDAIGFVSFAFTGGVNAVGYQGVACNLQNSKSGQYQGVRNFWMVTKGKPKGESKQFIEWVTSSKNPTAYKIISSDWVPVHP
ncbi:MAG TPA: phosphate ABC transporter substrate-binding protein [Solirubrobacteraceae bacterium]|jgi:phosphate transport system substrate-binding protein|nr:phosphate ABC transporter substrate-binding protein [Solirubrobacteraceae bacterium]